MTSAIDWIAGGTLSNVSQEIVTGLTTDYVKYLVVISGLVSVDQSSTNFGIQLSTNNGSTWITTADTFILRLQRSSGSDGNTVHFRGPINYAQIVNELSNNSGNFEAGNVEIFDPVNPATRTTVLARMGGKINTGGDSANPNITDTMSQREAAEAHNAIKFFATSGNFSMKYAMYGFTA